MTTPNSALNLDSLSSEDKQRLCGADWGRIAVGWPIKKAHACIGRDLHVVSEAAGGFRIWQHCYSYGECITVGEQDNRVASWNR